MIFHLANVRDTRWMILEYDKSAGRSAGVGFLNGHYYSASPLVVLYTMFTNSRMTLRPYTY